MAESLRRDLERADLVAEVVMRVLAAEERARADEVVAALVPRFADGAYVAIGSEGSPVQVVALAWRDSTKTEAIRAMLEGYHAGHGFSPAWMDETGALVARRFGVDDANSVTQRAAAAQLLQAAGATSAIVVPLGARGRVIGVMALSNGPERPAFDDSDLAAGIRIGSALGLAIDNAHLETARASEMEARRRAEAALADERSLLAAVFDASPDGMAVIDISSGCHRFRRLNPAFARLGDRAAEEVIGRADDELGMWAIRPWREFVRRASSAGRVHELVNDTANRWLVVDVVPLADLPGQVLISTHDVTERVQAEQRLRLEEERSERAMRVGRVLTWEYDIPTAEIRVSREALAALLGDEVADYTAEDWKEAVHPDDSGPLVDRVVGLVRAGEAVEHEVRIQHPERDGWTRVQLRAAPIRDALGNVVGAHGTAIDITAQRRAEEQLGTLLDQLPGPAAIVDRDFEIIRTNSANRALGPMASEVWFRVRAVVARAFETADPVSAEISGEEGGSPWLYLVQAVPLRLDDLLDNVLVLLQDLSERRRTELDRLEVERKLGDAKRLDGLGLLAGGFAHDVNNLLTTVLAHAQLAGLEDRDELEEHLEEIIGATRRAAELTDQLLAFAGRGRFSMGPVLVTDLVAAAREELKALMPAGGELEVAIEPDTPPALADPHQLRTVIVSLAANGAEALGARGGGVHITASLDILHADDLAGLIRDLDVQPGVFVRIEVSDDGAGMEPAVVERMFDPFFTTKFAGRGLGLAAVRGIVRAHRGALRVDSVANLGTRVAVWIPVADRPSPTPAVRTVHAGGHAAGLVLVVDDEPSVRAASARLLGRLGYSCELASDGGSALDMLRDGLPDVEAVLLDLTMPYMNGDEVARQIRVMRPTLPIILMSGYSTRELGEWVATLRLAGVLHKPFSIDTLRDVMERIRRPAAPPEA